eukprot:SAG11_NODE_30399_length_301_cov_1.004950_1_plen_25_part_10
MCHAKIDDRGWPTIKAVAEDPTKPN